MLLHRTPRPKPKPFLPKHTTHRQNHTNAPPRYHPKVRAFPFKISPREAVAHLAPYVSVQLLMKGIVGSIGARVFPGLFTPLQPTLITPVYFPIWIVDALVEANPVVAAEGEEGGEEDGGGGQSEERTVTAFLGDSYMPGFVYKFLSLLSLNSDTFRELDPVPFSPELEHQHGADITCLPYTLSPLALLDAARAMSSQEARVNAEFRIIPASIKARLLAAYPILIPLYLARYDVTILGQKIAHSVFIQAHSTNGRIVTENNLLTISTRLTHASESANPHPALQLLRSALRPPEGALEDPALTFRERDHTFAAVRHVLAPGPRPALGAALAGWLDAWVPKLETAAARGAALGDGEMEDLRVRAYDLEEVERTRGWAALFAEIAERREVISELSRSPEVRVFAIGGKVEGKSAKDLLIESLRKSVEGLEKAREEGRPQWWKDWEEANGKDGKS